MVQDIGDRQANTVILAGQAVDRATVQGLKSASAKSGVSFQYLLAKASQESSLNPDAQAETSSAAGLFQFTRGTWLDMVKRYGSQYGHADLARQILETPSGKLTVTDAGAEKRILALRQDPETSGLMAAEYARDNAAALKDTLGREPDAADLYLAHFLGASGAGALLNAAATTPNKDASDLVPAAAKANPAVFTTAGGDDRTAAQVVKLIRDRFTGQMDRYASADTVMNDAAPAPRAAIAAAPATAMASSPTGRLDLQQVLGGTDQTSANAMILDQLMRLILNGPLMPADDGDDDSTGGRKPLSAAGLNGSDWVDLMQQQKAAASAVAPQPTASRAYGAADPQSRTLDDTF
jgi:hypothetical protein